MSTLHEVPTETSRASVDAASSTLLGFLDRLACAGKPHTLDTLATTELTFSQLRVLFAVAAASGSSMPLNEVADHVHLSLASAGRAVDKLVHIALVDRREDPADRRVKRVSLTAEGQKLVDAQLSVKEDLISTFVENLPDDLRAGLVTALAPIIDSDVDHFASITAAPQRKH